MVPEGAGQTGDRPIELLFLCVNERAAGSPSGPGGGKDTPPPQQAAAIRLALPTPTF